MKKLLIILTLTFAFASCTKQEPDADKIYSVLPTAKIISVVKVYSGSNANNKVTYTLTGISGVSKVNFIISGSTVVLSAPMAEGKNVIYDFVSPIGPVLYNFLFTMKSGNQIPTPVEIFNP